MHAASPILRVTPLPPPPGVGRPIAQGRRVVRPRRRGQPLPPNTVYVGRPTIWGNPFSDRYLGISTRPPSHRKIGHAKSVKLHRQWLMGEIAALTLERMGFCPKEVEALERLRIKVLSRLHELAGKDLACWCPLTSRWCHADTLLELVPIHADYERFSL